MAIATRHVNIYSIQSSQWKLFFDALKQLFEHDTTTVNIENNRILFEISNYPCIPRMYQKLFSFSTGNLRQDVKYFDQVKQIAQTIFSDAQIIISVDTPNYFD